MVPAVPAAVETLTHPKLVQVIYFNQVGADPDHDYVEAGHVTITRCSRTALVLSWHCDGIFHGLDSGVRKSVRLADDQRHHRTGEDLMVNAANRGSDAYVYGHLYVIRMALILVGLVLFLAAAAALLIRRVPVGPAVTLLVLGLLVRLAAAAASLIL